MVQDHGHVQDLVQDRYSRAADNAVPSTDSGTWYNKYLLSKVTLLVTLLAHQKEDKVEIQGQLYPAR